MSSICSFLFVEIVSKKKEKKISKLSAYIILNVYVVMAWPWQLFYNDFFFFGYIKVKAF